MWASSVSPRPSSWTACDTDGPLLVRDVVGAPEQDRTIAYTTVWNSGPQRQAHAHGAQPSEPELACAIPADYTAGIMAEALASTTEPGSTKEITLLSAA